MTARTIRDLKLLALSAPLRRFARSLHPDHNASSFMVHRAMSAAFAERPCERDSARLEASLREDIARDFALRGALRGAARRPAAAAI